MNDYSLKWYLALRKSIPIANNKTIDPNIIKWNPLPFAILSDALIIWLTKYVSYNPNKPVHTPKISYNFSFFIKTPTIVPIAKSTKHIPLKKTPEDAASFDTSK